METSQTALNRAIKNHQITHDLRICDLAAMTGLSERSVYNRLARRVKWRAAEIDALSDAGVVLPLRYQGGAAA